MRRLPESLLCVLALCAAFSCARTDVGAPCILQDASGVALQPQPGREYLYLGSSECASFACLATPGATAGYCSQTCAGPRGSCPAGMVCAQLTLDQSFVDFMRATLPPDRFTALFGQLPGSYYCSRGGG